MIFIVDDDRDTRTLIAGVLERVGYATLEAATGEEALALAKRERPSLVILEVLLPGASGYEVCRQLRDEFGEELPIVFVSGERTEPADRVAGLLLGADDYIVKPFDQGELLARVRRLLPRSGPVAAAVASRLTAREQEVLSLLVEGFDQSEIAERLVVSPKTVSKHVEHILGKLGVRSRAQAVAVAVRDRLIETSDGQPGHEALPPRAAGAIRGPA